MIVCFNKQIEKWITAIRIIHVTVFVMGEDGFTIHSQLALQYGCASKWKRPGLGCLIRTATFSPSQGPSVGPCMLLLLLACQPRAGLPLWLAPFGVVMTVHRATGH